MSKFSRALEILPIGEEEEFEIVTEGLEEEIHPLDTDVVKADLKKKRAKTAVLADEAESNIMELQWLLRKTNMRTATRAEKDRLLSLNLTLSALKSDIKKPR
jgi:hypothetical protein